MPRYIVKLTDKKSNTDYYLEWSTIVDAPVTYGCPLDEFKEYYKSQYGKQGLDGLEDRLLRVEKNGTSAYMDMSVKDTISVNRAGPNETELTEEEIIQRYCIDKTA